MHVAVDAHNLPADRRGIGVYVRAVLSRMLLRSDWDITLLVRGALPALKKRELAKELGASHFRVANRMPRAAGVAWHPWNGTFFEGAAANVSTIHDTAPFAFPEPDERKRRSQQEPFRRSAGRSKRILADSEFTRSQIEVHLNVEPGRITVVPLAASAAFSPGAPQTLPRDLRPGSYMLYVGTLEAHKNVEPLIEAWRRADLAGVELVIVGPSSAPPGVRSLSGVSQDALRDLYRGALGLAFPSLYEGFGLPPLEAMACGTPTVVARCASLPEVCGDAALYVDEPRDAEAWRRALVRLHEDAALRRDLSTRGIAQAAKFSWDRTAAMTLQAIEEAAQ